MMNSSDSTNRKRILIMDDESMIRDVCCKMLDRLGYDAEAVADGREAIEAYQQARQEGHPFDLVIMDLTIPNGMDGREAIGHLKQFDPAAKALVSSGYSSDPAVHDAEDHGFAGVVNKPYSVKDLDHAIREALA